MCTLNILSLCKKFLTKGLLFKVLAITLLSTAVSYANLCPIGYGGAECEDLPDYTGSTEGFEGNAATESDCERLGYSDYGASPSNKAPNSADDIWPAKARKNSANNTAEYHCDRCEIGGNIILNSQGKARWSCYRLCQDVSAATTMPNVGEGAPYRRHFVNNQKDCDTIYGKFDSGKSKTHFEWVTKNVCGKCVDLQCDGLVVTDNEGNNQAPEGCYKVEKTYTMEDGTVCANAKQWEKMSEEWVEESELLSGCYDVEEIPTASGGKCYKQTEMSTICPDGYRWNDYNNSYRSDQPHCQCVPTYCPDGSSTDQIEGCYDYIDTGYKSGEQECWKSVAKDPAQQSCPTGQKFDVDSCGCVEVDCTAGGLKETCVATCEGGKRVTCSEEPYEGKTCYRETETEDIDCSLPCSAEGYVDECVETCAGGVEVTCNRVMLEGRPCYEKTEVTKAECNDAVCSDFTDNNGRTLLAQCSNSCEGTTETICTPVTPDETTLSCYSKTEQECSGGCEGNVCSNKTCSNFTDDYGHTLLEQCSNNCEGTTETICTPFKPDGTTLSCYSKTEQECSGGCSGGMCPGTTCTKLQYAETNPGDKCEGNVLTTYEEFTPDGTNLRCWRAKTTTTCRYGCKNTDCNSCPAGYEYAENASSYDNGGYDTTPTQDGMGICYRIKQCPSDAYTQSTHSCGENATFKPINPTTYSGSEVCGKCECNEGFAMVDGQCKADVCPTNDRGYAVYREGVSELASCTNRYIVTTTVAGTKCQVCDDCPKNLGYTTYREGDAALNDGRNYELLVGVKTYSGKACYKLSDCDDTCQTFINQGYTLTTLPTSAAGTYLKTENCCVPHYKCVSGYIFKDGKCLSDECPVAGEKKNATELGCSNTEEGTPTPYGSKCYKCANDCDQTCTKGNGYEYDGSEVVPDYVHGYIPSRVKTCVACDGKTRYKCDGKWDVANGTGGLHVCNYGSSSGGTAYIECHYNGRSEEGGPCQGGTGYYNCTFHVPSSGYIQISIMGVQSYGNPGDETFEIASCKLNSAICEFSGTSFGRKTVDLSPLSSGGFRCAY